MTIHKKNIQLTLKLFIFLSIMILLTGCEKYRIKRHYTGNFHFISINQESNYNGTGPGWNTVTDTIESDGKIEWAEDDIIMISFTNSSYRVHVDKNGNLTLVDNNEPYDPHGSTSLEGNFVNDDELKFTYSDRYSFGGHGWDTYKVVNGSRL